VAPEEAMGEDVAGTEKETSEPPAAAERPPAPWRGESGGEVLLATVDPEWCCLNTLESRGGAAPPRGERRGALPPEDGAVPIAAGLPVDVGEATIADDEACVDPGVRAALEVGEEEALDAGLLVVPILSNGVLPVDNEEDDEDGMCRVVLP